MLGMIRKFELMLTRHAVNMLGRGLRSLSAFLVVNRVGLIIAPYFMYGRPPRRRGLKKGGLRKVEVRLITRSCNYFPTNKPQIFAGNDIAFECHFVQIFAKFLQFCQKN